MPWRGVVVHNYLVVALREMCDPGPSQRTARAPLPAGRIQESPDQGQPIVTVVDFAGLYGFVATESRAIIKVPVSPRVGTGQCVAV